MRSFVRPAVDGGIVAIPVRQQVSLMAEAQGQEVAVHPLEPTGIPPAGDGWSAPVRQRWTVRRSFLVHAINALSGTVGQATLASLDEEELIKAASRRAGHDDFGDVSFREPLRRLVSSFQTEAHLHPLGRLTVRRQLTMLLVNRLRLQENRRRHPGIVEQHIRRPIIITGLPRTGTTFLHGLLALDPANRVPRTWETLYPSPPPEAETYHVDRRIALVDRQLRWLHRMVRDVNRVHPIGARLPEECLVLLGHSFLSYLFVANHRLPSYVDWLDSQDLRPSYEMHRRFLQHLQWRCPGERWVLKTPAHMFDFEAMFEVYPDACVVMTHRDPIEVTASNASLTATLRCAFSDEVDPVEVGRECSRRWAEALNRALRSRDSGCLPSERFLDLYYTDLVADPVAAVERVYRHFDLPLPDGLRETIRESVKRNPKNRFGQHRYNLHDFGLDLQEEEKRYAAYRERFRL
ncbi:MAG: sulfotransferase [Nitrospira sp. LK265]|nr:sulfotransferase [Nitrospira sp. LK265]